MCTKGELGVTCWENDRQQMDAKDNRMETFGKEKIDRGRPQTRWSDDIKRLAGHDWMRKTSNREEWQKLRKAFTRRWVE